MGVTEGSRFVNSPALKTVSRISRAAQRYWGLSFPTTAVITERQPDWRSLLQRSLCKSLLIAAPVVTPAVRGKGRHDHTNLVDSVSRDDLGAVSEVTALVKAAEGGASGERPFCPVEVGTLVVQVRCRGSLGC